MDKPVVKGTNYYADLGNQVVNMNYKHLPSGMILQVGTTRWVKLGDHLNYIKYTDMIWELGYDFSIQSQRELHRITILHNNSKKSTAHSEGHTQTWH